MFFKEAFCDACILSISINTTGIQGGDAGHGGHTSVLLEFDGSGTLEVDFNQNQQRVKIAVGGDAELRTLANAMVWAGRILMGVSNQNDPDRINDPDFGPK